jgi:hypothetical protein
LPHGVWWRSEKKSFRPEVVVDDVEKNRQTACVTGLDQTFQVFWSAIARRRRIDVGAVIAPAARPGKLGYRHQLNGGRAKRTNMIEVAHRADKVAGLGERAQMQFVKDDFLPSSPTPSGSGPGIHAGIDDFARAMNAFRLAA